MREAKDFENQVKFLKLTHKDVGRCTFCKYMTQWVFRGDKVFFDPGCYCKLESYRKAIWQDIADEYNIQTCLDIIQKMDVFWQWNKVMA